MFTISLIGITVLLTIAFALFDYVSSSESEGNARNKEDTFDKMTALVRPQCLALEQVVRASVKKKRPLAQEEIQEGAVSEIMRQHALEFMDDASAVNFQHLIQHIERFCCRLKMRPLT